MAINRLNTPTVPNPIAGDWSKVVELLNKAFININSPIQVVSGIIPQGCVFQIGGVIYVANSDTIISGTASDYVKLVPNVSDDGATVDAVYVSNLSGVTWNSLYNGYYDGTGNMYLFNEHIALANQYISVLSQRYLTQESDGSVKVKIKGNYYLDLSTVSLDTNNYLIVE